MPDSAPGITFLLHNADMILSLLTAGLHCYCPPLRCFDRLLQYLVESIRMFPKQQELKELMKDAGFKVVSHTDLTFGVVAIHSGFKL